MARHNSIRKFSIIMIPLLLFTMNNLSLITGESSSDATKEIEKLSQEITELEQKFNERLDLENNLYLLFFEKKSEYSSFITKSETEMNFDGLMGTIVKTTSTGLSDIVKKTSGLLMSNVHPIHNSQSKMVPFSSLNQPVHSSIQSIPSARVIGADTLWKMGYRGQGTTISVFDEGINASHPDFSFPNGTSRIKAAKGFINTIYGNTENLTNSAGSHGTWVAGIAAGGGIGTASNQGIANESWILDADLDEGPEDYMDFTILGEIAAINWAIENGVDIINRSYGIAEGEDAYWYMRLVPDFLARSAAIRQATKLGVLFVHSAGNDGGTHFTISADNLIHEITVGATDQGMYNIASYSSRGPIWRTDALSPDLVAPGTNVPTPDVDGGYGDPQGTSFAAPHVAGVAAVLISAMRQNGVNVNPGAIKASLMATASDLGAQIHEQGTGQVNATAAFEALLNAPRVGNHAIIGTVNPKNMQFTNFPHILQGSKIRSPFTFVSSELNNVSVQIEGNISSFLTIKEQKWINSSNRLYLIESELSNGSLDDQYSHSLTLHFSVPDDAPIGSYSGQIKFKVNSTDIYSTPFQFNIESGNKKILFVTKNRASYPYNTLGEFLDFQVGLSEQGIVVNENNSEITTAALAGYDAIWIAAGNRTYQKYEYISLWNEIARSGEETVITTQELNALKSFISNGGSLILTPFSTPLGIESLINDWGISTREITVDTGIKPAEISHFNSIGKSTQFFDASGSYFSVTSPATPLAYKNERENVVMASYDDPNGGRVVIVSGSTFIATRGYNNRINDIYPYNELLFNDRLAMDIIDWSTSSQQLFGSFERNDDQITFALYASVDSIPENMAIIEGKSKDMATGVESNISSHIPQNGTNGWYNFTLSLPDGVYLFNFTWESEFIAFEFITDEIKPKVGFFGMDNNSYLIEDSEITFWFRDDESGINRYNVTMKVDGIRVGFNGPKVNYTGTGFYIKKPLIVDDYAGGTHEITLIVYDIAGNSATTRFVFIRGTPPGSGTTEGKASGFLLESFLGLVLVTCAIQYIGRKKYHK